MSIANQLIIGLAVAAAFSLVLALARSRSSHTVRGFYWGNHEIKIPAAISLFLAQSFSLNGIVYQIWLGYSIGAWGFLMQAIWSASFFFLRRHASQLREMAGTATLHGNIAKRFGHGAGVTAAIASFLGFGLLIGWELTVGKSLFSAVVPASESLWLVVYVCLAVIAAYYTLRGGVVGDANANLFQNLVKCVGLSLVAGIFIYRWLPSYSSLNLAFAAKGLKDIRDNIGILGFITNAVFSIFWQYVDMSVWQDIATVPERGSDAKRTLVGSAVAVFLFPGVVGTLIGMALSKIPALTSDNITPTVMLEIARSHPLIGISLVAGCIGAILGTVDGALIAMVQTLVWDILKPKQLAMVLSPHRSDHEGDQRQADMDLVARSKSLLVPIAVGAAVGSYFLAKVVSVFNFVYVVTFAQMSLVPVVLVFFGIFDQKVAKVWWQRPLTFNWLKPRNPNGFLSVVVGVIAGAATMAVGLCYPNVDWILTVCPLVSLVAAYLCLFIRKGGDEPTV